MRKYISVSSLENFREKCSGQFDVSFTAREVRFYSTVLRQLYGSLVAVDFS